MKTLSKISLILLSTLSFLSCSDDSLQDKDTVLKLVVKNLELQNNDVATVLAKWGKPEGMTDKHKFKVSIYNKDFPNEVSTKLLMADITSYERKALFLDKTYVVGVSVVETEGSGESEAIKKEVKVANVETVKRLREIKDYKDAGLYIDARDLKRRGYLPKEAIVDLNGYKQITIKFPTTSVAALVVDLTETKDDKEKKRLEAGVSIKVKIRGLVRKADYTFDLNQSLVDVVTFTTTAKLKAIDLETVKPPLNNIKAVDGMGDAKIMPGARYVIYIRGKNVRGNSNTVFSTSLLYTVSPIDNYNEVNLASSVPARDESNYNAKSIVNVANWEVQEYEVRGKPPVYGMNLAREFTEKITTTHHQRKGVLTTNPKRSLSFIILGEPNNLAFISGANRRFYFGLGNYSEEYKGFLVKGWNSLESYNNGVAPYYLKPHYKDSGSQGNLTKTSNVDEAIYFNFKTTYTLETEQIGSERQDVVPLGQPTNTIAYRTIIKNCTDGTVNDKVGQDLTESFSVGVSSESSVELISNSTTEWGVDVSATVGFNVFGAEASASVSYSHNETSTQEKGMSKLQAQKGSKEHSTTISTNRTVSVGPQRAIEVTDKKIEYEDVKMPYVIIYRLKAKPSTGGVPNRYISGAELYANIANALKGRVRELGSDYLDVEFDFNVALSKYIVSVSQTRDIPGVCATGKKEDGNDFAGTEGVGGGSTGGDSAVVGGGVGGGLGGAGLAAADGDAPDLSEAEDLNNQATATNGSGAKVGGSGTKGNGGVVKRRGAVRKP